MNYKFIQKLEDTRKNIFSKSRLCLVSNCNEIAINSHVFQKNKILDQISKPDNHFYSWKFPSIFSLIKNPTFKVDKVGINEGYSFPGFCQKHDDEIFAPIEKSSVDFYLSSVQALFTYRTLCLELRKKEIAKDIKVETAKIIYESKNKNWLSYYLAMDQPILDFKQAIKDLSFFKSQLENEIFNSGESKFNYTTLKFPRLDVCFSTPLSIFDVNNDNSNEIDEYGFDKEIPISTSVLNFFPYDNFSYFISANHKEYFCNWTSELIKKMKVQNVQLTKIISDILSYRCEFWAISQSLFQLIDLNKISEFEKISHDHFDNYNYNIDSQFNLFENINYP